MNDQETQLEIDDADLSELRLDSAREEEMLVAHMFLRPRLIKKVAITLTREMYMNVGEYAEAVQALIELQNRTQGVPTRTEVIEVCEPIFRRSVSASAEFAKRVNEADDDAKSGEYYLRRVVDRYGRRRMFAEVDMRKILSETWNVSDALATVRENLLDVNRAASMSTGRGGLLKHDFHDNMDVLHDRLEGKIETGFKTGFENLDQILDDVKASSYNIIGARPSIGKTAVTINLVLAMAMRGIRVKFITLEVPYDVILELMACCYAKIIKNSIKKKATHKTREQLSETYEALHKLPIELHANCSDISQIISICEDALTRPDPTQAIFVDYVQIIRTRKSYRQDIDRLNVISRAFRDLKSDHQVALFIAAQLNRKSADGVPKLEDLKGTGDFEQDADTVLLLHRPNKDMAEREDASGMSRTVFDDQLDIYVRKNRMGRTGRVSFRWDGATGKITTMSEEDRAKADKTRQMAENTQTKKQSRQYNQKRNYNDGSMETEDDLPF